MASRLSRSELPLPARAAVSKHDHAVCVYDSENRLLMDFDEFLRGGLVAQEVTTFLHAHPSGEGARRMLAKKIPDVSVLCDHQDLLLAHHRDAFELGGRIDHAHAASVVHALVEEARDRGRAGSRIFVDASKEYLGSGRKDEWFGFESWLGPRLETEVALVCAYDAKHLQDADVLARVLATHAYRYESPTIRVL